MRWWRRVHAQALLVLDDEDFHQRQDMLSLGQHRAIATALNSLVFHTHCPAPQPSHNGGQGLPQQQDLPAMQGMLLDPSKCIPLLTAMEWCLCAASLQASASNSLVAFSCLCWPPLLRPPLLRALLHQSPKLPMRWHA